MHLLTPTNYFSPISCWITLSKEFYCACWYTALGVSNRTARRKENKRDLLNSTIPFPLPTRFQLKPIHPIIHTGSRDTLLSTFSKTQTSLPKTGHVGIIDPNDTPQYAAFRLHNIITPDQQSLLYDLVQEIAKTRLKSHIIKSRGAEFHQWWFGVWCRYAKHAFLSADTRKKSSQTPVSTFLKAYDHLLHTIGPSLII